MLSYILVFINYRRKGFKKPNWETDTRSWFHHIGCSDFKLVLQSKFPHSMILLSFRLCTNPRSVSLQIETCVPSVNKSRLPISHLMQFFSFRRVVIDIIFHSIVYIPSNIYAVFLTREKATI